MVQIIMIMIYEKKDQYVIKDCLFVVRNLDLFIKQLSLEKGIAINKKDKRNRAKINDMSSFLGCLYAAYRDSIHECFFRVKQECKIGDDIKLSRISTAYKNIH